MSTPLALKAPVASRTDQAEPAYTYDEERQLNVTSSGAVFVEVADFFGPTMTLKAGGGPARKDDD